MKKYIVLLLLIIANNLISSPIDISTGNNFISIKINSLSSHHIQDKYLNYNYLKLKDIKITIPFQKDEFFVDELQFLVAIPENTDFKIEKKLSSKRLLRDKINLSQNIDESVTVQKIGIQRGIFAGIIKINPYKYQVNTNSLFIFDSIEVTLKFDKPIPTSDFTPNNPEFKFFSEYINKPHIPELLKIAYKNKLDSKQNDKNPKNRFLNEDWYNPDVTYAKIMTRNDGIAKIVVQDLINTENSFSGKNTKYIHLLFKGKEVPISFNNDSDSLLNAGDEIIFLGHRGEGDTTWFNNYSDFSAFHLYYDETSPGLRFTNFPEINSATKTLDHVYIDRHIEYENFYLPGDFELQWDIETIHREGWLWKVIGSENKNKFQYDFSILPADTLSMKINLLSAFWNKALIKKHDLALVINNDTLSKFSLDTGNILKFNQEILVNQLVSGKNKFSLANLVQRDFANSIIIPDDIGIDFIEMQGKANPIAFDGKTDFNIAKQTEDFKLIIPNFSSSEIFLLDKDLKFLSKIQGQQGTNIITGVKSGSYPYASIIVNDTAFTTQTNSLNIAICKAPNYNAVDFRSFNDLNNQVVDFINSVKTGSVLAITYNSDKNPTANIISKLQSLGSSSISQVKAGDVWTFIVKTDEISNAIEKYQTSGSANLSRFLKHNSGKSFEVEKQLQRNTDLNILAFDYSAIEKAEVYKVNNTNLKNENHRADAIFITHNKFRRGADSLAEYRRSKGYAVEVVDIEDVYKEFNFGIKSALSIKSFLKYAFDKWQEPVPQYLLIIGDANWDTRNHMVGSVNVDYVPAYGWPVSDFWYTCLDSATDYLHDMFVGRIPAFKEEHIFNVANKIKEYETTSKMPWMKKFLSLTGGGDEAERLNFKENMDVMLQVFWQEKPFAGDTMFVAKKANGTVGLAEANEIISKIDGGAIWVNFYGHGAPTVFDMDGWHANKLNNKGKYSFFTTISCNTAAFAEPEGIARNEDYLTIADRGFIATGGSSNVGIDLPGMLIVRNMMNLLTDTIHYERLFGEFFNNAKNNMVAYDPLTRAFAQQFILLGDPLTKIRIPVTRDIYLLENEVKITNYWGNTIIIDTDSLAHIEGYIYNNGYCERNNLYIRLIHKYNNEVDSFDIPYSSLCIKEHFLFDSVNILNKPGVHEVELLAVLSDTNLQVYQGSFEVFKSGLLAVDPLDFWNIDGNNIHFRFINPVQNFSGDYEFIVTKLNSLSIEDTIYISRNSEIKILENSIDWLPDTTLAKGNNFYLYSRYFDKNKNIESDWLRIPFTTDMQEAEKVKIKLENEFLNNCYLKDFSLKEKDGSKVIQFSEINKEFQLTSAKGNDSVTRYGEIIYDNEIYIFTPGQFNAPVGINLIVVSGKDGEYITTRKFNTWDGENSTRDLVTFLNDTVETGDWVLLSSCGSAMRMFYHTGKNNPDSIGGYKSFKQALSNYGSLLVNDIPEDNDVPKVSFVFAGQKGTIPGDAMENIVLDGSKIFLSDTITIKQKDAWLMTPEIFSSKKWENCKIDADIDFTKATSKLSVWGMPDKNKWGLLKEFVDTLSVNLEFVSSYTYPGMVIQFRVNRLSDSSDISINNIEINFSPNPELAVLQSKSNLQPDTVMRAEPANLNYRIENLSLRSPAENPRVQIGIQPQGLSELIFRDTLDNIPSNQSIPSEFPLQTLQLTDSTIVKVYANVPKHFNELYDFNNHLQKNLYLRRDIEKPFIKLKFDGVEIKDSAFVSMYPFIEVELFDYSFEPVASLPEPIKVWINSYRQMDTNTSDFKLALVNEDEFKAVLSFKSDTLFDWDNRIEVVYQDASGNSDTLEYHIFTSFNAFITSPLCEPNPVTESARFTFHYKAIDYSGNSEISIFDITGRKIRSINTPLNIGKNEVDWDGYDDYGNSITQGVYLYLIRAVGPYYSDPVTGKFLKLK